MRALPTLNRMRRYATTLGAIAGPDVLPRAGLILAGLLLGMPPCLAQSGDPAITGPPPAPAPAGPSGLARWLNPATSPIIPIPEIDVDPNTGTTVGLIPTWLRNDEHGNINRIVAPDVIKTQNFGYGSRFRIFDYPSPDTQWYVIAGAKERVESEFHARYETGRLRDGRWSLLAEAVYDRSGTARFYGIGNHSHSLAQSVYTNQQLFMRLVVGWNFNPRWQLAWWIEPRKVKIVSATLKNIPSTTHLYDGLLGLGTTHELLQRLALTYDTRDDLVVPTRGMAVTLYSGVASRQGGLDESLFLEVGADARLFWSPSPWSTWAFHAATRYLPLSHQAPFWALSSLGGDVSALGESQPLRGFGTSRFYGANAFSVNVEYRRTVLALDIFGTHLDFQATPFFDAGRVSRLSRTFPLGHLHYVGGFGVRAIARPSVVGYVDVGKGSEGVAVFTGINYPF